MSRPKLSIGSWAFAFGPFESAPWSFDRVLRYAAEAGYDGIEINGFRPHPHPDDYSSPAACAELRKQIEDLGLGISGYAPDLTAVPPAHVETEAYLTAVRKSLQFCQRLGIRTLRVDTVSPPDPLEPEEYEKRFARLARTWGAAANEADQAGVTLVWEFEPGFWLNKPSEVKRLAEAAESDAFRLLFDTSHAYMGAVVGARQTGETETLPGGVPDYARFLKEHIGHLHLIDSDGTLHNDETSTHTPFGLGKVDFVATLSQISELAGSFEWWCADFCFCAETETAGREAVECLYILRQEVLS